MQTARVPPKAGVSAKRISSSFRDCNNYSIEMVLRKHNFVPIRVSYRRSHSSSALRRGPWAAYESCVSLADDRFLRPRCDGTLGLHTSPVSLADDCSLRPHCGEGLGLHTSPVSLLQTIAFFVRTAARPLGCRRVLCLSCRRLLSSSALRWDLRLQTSPVSLLQTIAFFVRAAAGPWAADESCVSRADCRRAVGTWGTHYVHLCTATCEAQAEARLREIQGLVEAT